MRSMIEKYRIINKLDTTNLFKVIKSLNDIYNSSYHTIIKTKPIDIINELVDREIIKPVPIEKYNIGDYVRIYIKDDLDPFNKLSPLWSKKIYKIEGYNNRTGYYNVENDPNRYKYNHLQKIDKDNLMVFNRHIHHQR